MDPLEESPHIVRCSYCDAQEQLPPDHAARVDRLRQRLAGLRAAKSHLSAAALRASSVFEGGVWLKGTLKAALGPAALIIGLLVVPMICVSGQREGPIEARVPAVAAGLFWLLLLIFLVGGMAVGFTLLSRRYRKVIRPRILARPPTEEGGASRCRWCGGSLPGLRAPFVTCDWCGASNLLSETSARQRDRLLKQEIQEYERRARSGRQLADEQLQLLPRSILIGYLTGMVLALVLSAPLSRVLARFVLAIVG